MSTRTSPPRRPVGRPGDGADVRGAILAAALRQLEASGSPDRVTIAAIVAEAGCTPPSLYHYWPGRVPLLHEASTLGWAQFRADQRNAATGHDPIERLRSRGRAYLDFALGRPALFRVLFLEPGAASPPDSPAAMRDRPETSPTPGDALQELLADVAAAMAAGTLRPADPLTTGLALWSAVHGVAALWAANSELPTGLAHAVAELAQDAVLIGLATAPTRSR